MRRSDARGVVWLTGLSASGKSTLAGMLEEALRKRGFANLTLLDGETCRQQMFPQYGHGLEDREKVLELLVGEALRAYEIGRVVIVATVSHKRTMRQHARATLPRFMEVFLNCPPQVCASRDVKGHYTRASRGEYECFVGITEPYELSDPAPELVLDTHHETPAESAARLVQAALPFLAERS